MRVMTLKIMNPNEELTEYENAKDFLWRCRNTVDINRNEKIELVIYQFNINYNMWDFDYRNYPLTYETLYDWLQLMERQERHEEEYIRHSTLRSYLEKISNSMYTTFRSQQDSASTHIFSDDIELHYTEPIPNRVKSDSFEKNNKENDKGVTSKYATYYTLFRRGR